MNVRSTMRAAALLFATAVLVTLAACGTGTGAPSPASAASTAAITHTKADLTAAYDSLTLVRKGTLTAYQSGVLPKAKASAIEDQCTHLTTALKDLEALGSPADSAVKSQISAIADLVALAASEGVIVK